MRPHVNLFIPYRPSTPRIFYSSTNKTIKISRSNSRRASRLKMTSMNFENDVQNNDIQIDIVLKALSNSFMKQISEGEGQLDLTEASSKLGIRTWRDKEIHYKVTHSKWGIIYVDEGQLSQTSFVQRLLCNMDSKSSPLDRPRSLKLYQLIMSFEGKQINLVSLENPNKFYVVNLDLIEVLLDYTVNTHYEDQLIRLKINGKLNIDLYITAATMPLIVDQGSTTRNQQKARNKKIQLQEYLIKSIRQSWAVKLSLSSPLIFNDEDYLHKRFATEQQFAKYCQTGDLLLFKDNHTMAKVQRVVTNSQYDHMGIVYRSQKFGICVFESSSGLGVAMAVWNHLIKHRWFENIQKISWRKLQYDRPPDFESKTTEFIKGNLHKKFGISLPKLLKFKSIVYTSPEQEKDKTYFCSQLVATLYKHLGLLQPSISSTQYWPKHFTDKGDIKMLKNSSLAQQRHLIFDQNILRSTYSWFK